MKNYVIIQTYHNFSTGERFTRTLPKRYRFWLAAKLDALDYFTWRNTNSEGLTVDQSTTRIVKLSKRGRHVNA